MARSPKPSLLSDAIVFATGAFVALLLFLSFSSFLSPATLTPPSTLLSSPQSQSQSHLLLDVDLDPPTQSFYDDPSLSYSIDHPISNWDEKRLQWLNLHPSSSSTDERVLIVSGSQPAPCKNPVGDHLLLRFLKNKLDYSRLHNLDLFYNTALLHPSMPTFWAKIPILRAAMLAHPETDWIWWVDSDAAFTDMDFSLPLHRYKSHNLVVHGWPELVYEAKSWVSLNAGVFLIRNCQWSLDFMDTWAAMGPNSPNYDSWGKTLKSTFKDKVFPESDDQSALVYLLLTGKDKWADKIYLENNYYFEGYWVEIVGRLDNITARYEQMERTAPKDLRRRHAEKVTAKYAEARNERLAEEGMAVSGPAGWRRPFVTHFTGCQPCSGDHNKMYSGENCYEGMTRALDLADDQVLRAYGFRHHRLGSSDVTPLPFDFPATH
ncbi:probable glycosyltransferase 7 [Typha angustifolia]|uniref:probable glycosyltransferase 7 n=1 Tax=Typha angustifolia TaxID=59011 RepID=UPI003C2E9233